VHPRVRAAALTLIAILSACGKSGTAPSTTELAGTWRATKAEFVNRANSSQKVELVSIGGDYTLSLTAAGSFTATITSPGKPERVLAGTYSASLDMLSLTYTSGSFGQSEFDMTLSGNTLTLTGGSSTYDVNGDGQDEETALNLVLGRQ
jgi:hypothetical protein